MWPRSEEERSRQRLNGFVAFVKRSDAARAKEQMNEVELNGYVMKIGWGKASRAAHVELEQQPPVGVAWQASGVDGRGFGGG